MREWSRQDILGIAALGIGIAGFLTSVMLPETRELLGLSPAGDRDTPPPVQQAANLATTEPSPASPAMIPADSVPQIRETGTGAVAEDASETPGDMEVAPAPVQESNTTSEELRRERDARLYAEQAERRHQASQRDQEEFSQEREARARGELTRRAPEPRAASKGLVFFKIEPRDASLYLDGKLMGLPRGAATDGVSIEAGDYSLVVMKPGYKTREVTLTVIAGDPLEVEVELQPD